MNTRIFVCFLLFSTGLARGQSTLSEFNILKKQRDAAAEKAISPIRAKFSVEASLLINKAIQAGDLDLAAKIKQEIVSDQKSVELSKILVESKWIWKVDGRPEWSGSILQFKSDGTIAAEGDSDNFKRWEKIDGNKIKVFFSRDRKYIFEYDPFEECFKVDLNSTDDRIKRTFTKKI